MKVPYLSGSSLARNTGWMLVGQVLTVGLQATYFIMLARLLGSTEYGIFVGAAAVVALFSNFSSLGSGMLLLRYVSADHSKFREYWGNTILATLGMGSLMVVLCAMLGPRLLHAASGNMLTLIAVGDCIFATLSACASQAFQAFERLKVTALLNAVTSATRLTAACALSITLHHVSAAEWAIASVCVSAIAVAVAGICVSTQLGLPRFRFRLLIEKLQEGLGFSVAYSTTSIYNDIDKALLTHFGMYAANGAYAVAYRLLDIACIPIRSLHAAAFARFFRAGQKGVNGAMSFSKNVVKRTLPYSILVATAILLFAPVTPVLIGASFRSTVPALRWLCLIPALRSLHLSAGDAVTSAGYQRFRTASQLGAAALNVALNIYLIPKYSWMGAAWSSLLTDGALGLSNWTILRVLRTQALSSASVDLRAA
jgi:O-antigen/teichoic acid export membrane protein